MAYWKTKDLIQSRAAKNEAKQSKTSRTNFHQRKNYMVGGVA